MLPTVCVIWCCFNLMLPNVLRWCSCCTWLPRCISFDAAVASSLYIGSTHVVDRSCGSRALLTSSVKCTRVFGTLVLACCRPIMCVKRFVYVFSEVRLYIGSRMLSTDHVGQTFRLYLQWSARGSIYVASVNTWINWKYIHIYIDIESIAEKIPQGIQTLQDSTTTNKSLRNPSPHQGWAIKSEDTIAIIMFFNTFLNHLLLNTYHCNYLFRCFYPFTPPLGH